MLHNGERKKDGIGRLPVERAHGEIIVLSLPNSKLLGKVFKGIECVAGIKLSRVAQIFVSGVAHFFIDICKVLRKESEIFLMKCAMERRLSLVV